MQRWIAPLQSAYARDTALFRETAAQAHSVCRSTCVLIPQGGWLQLLLSTRLGFAQATPLSKESPEIQVLDSERLALGPVAAYSGADVTKSLSFALPPGADADISRLGEAVGGAGAPSRARGAYQGMAASAGAPAPAFTDAMRQALRASSDPLAAAFGG